MRFDTHDGISCFKVLQTEILLHMGDLHDATVPSIDIVGKFKNHYSDKKGGMKVAFEQ